MLNYDILEHSYYYNLLIYRYIYGTLFHHYSSEDAPVGGGIFPTHFFGQKNPSFFDHFKRRSEKT
jgi:hypothetical protein